MKRPLVLERGVEEEIEAATEWYEAEREGLGLELARDVRAVFEKLVSRRVLGGVTVPGVSADLPVRNRPTRRAHGCVRSRGCARFDLVSRRAKRVAGVKQLRPVRSRRRA